MAVATTLCQVPGGATWTALREELDAGVCGGASTIVAAVPLSHAHDCADVVGSVGLLAESLRLGRAQIIVPESALAAVCEHLAVAAKTGADGGDPLVNVVVCTPGSAPSPRLDSPGLCGTAVVAILEWDGFTLPELESLCRAFLPNDGPRAVSGAVASPKCIMVASHRPVASPLVHCAEDWCGVGQPFRWFWHARKHRVTYREETGQPRIFFVDTDELKWHVEVYRDILELIARPRIAIVADAKRAALLKATLLPAATGAPRHTARIVAPSEHVTLSESADLQQEIEEKLSAEATGGFAVILTPQQCLGPWAEFVSRLVTLRLFDAIADPLFLACLHLGHDTQTGRRVSPRRCLCVAAVTEADHRSNAVLHVKGADAGNTTINFADGSEASELPMNFVDLLDD